MAKQKIKEFRSPRGTHDILPEEQRLWDKIRQEAREISLFYGFDRIDPPHFEHTELFELGIGSDTEIVTKQMYSFRTRGGDSLTLRPEGTPSIMRAFFEHGMLNLPQPVKLYYFGSFFRHESPQRGRSREFNQWGLELIGEQGPVADAQIIQALFVFLKELGLKNAIIEINSIGCEVCRPRYRSELAAYYRSRAKGLCKDCKERFRQNPLRLLDCKEEKCMIVRQGAPQILDHLCENCKTHFKLLLEFLDESSLPYLLNPYLVRGLDYYTRTVFEVFVGEEEEKKEKKPGVVEEAVEVSENKEEPPDLGLEQKEKEVIPVKEEVSEMPKRLALGGGGRYDNLAEIIGGKIVPAVGAAMGIERVILALKMQGHKMPEPNKPKVFFVQLGELARRKSLPLIEELRKARISMAESLGKDSIKTQLKIADKVGAEYALIFGQKEALDGTMILREMSSGIQEALPQDKLIEALKKRLRK
ncbi:MAG: histidine--tRNA ligase [bacterium]|nr:histidine--tRNA ligase [bacterium]